ncbi:RHBT1 protein, partial [Chloropsis hardwickii]|nr:RHBT1 protein [Chloropsis hardwickii]
RSDVVVLCFSLANPNSLRHVKTMWYPEIKHFCPRTPIVLVGCQLDLRYADLDAVNRARRPLAKPIKPSDILPPERGHEVAQELGVPYYETSVVAQFGVKDVFDNAIRAALVSRRHLQFWKSHLRKMQRPLLQAPFLPPKPPPPLIQVPDAPPGLGGGPAALFQAPLCADVVFQLQGGHRVFAHRVYLATACSRFYDLFTLETLGEGDEGTRDLSSWGRGFLSLRWEPVADPVAGRERRMAVAVVSEGWLSPWRGCPRDSCPHDCVDQGVAVPGLLCPRRGCPWAEGDEGYLRGGRPPLSCPLSPDVVFRVDDGAVPAHKPLLIAGCDWMRAMFRGGFRESYAGEVSLPGTNCACLRAVLDFLYTGVFTPTPDLDAMELLILTDRLCLPRLQALTGEPPPVSPRWGAQRLRGGGVTPLNPRPQFHRGGQLAAWCLHYICTRGGRVCRRFPREMKFRGGGRGWERGWGGSGRGGPVGPELRDGPAERGGHFERHRWPPVWYRGGEDLYLRSKKERERGGQLQRKQHPRSKWWGGRPSP